MKKVLIFGLILASTVSCRIKAHKSEDPGEIVRGTHQLEGEELALGIQICKALNDKRIDFGRNTGKELKFKLDYTDCGILHFPNNQTVSLQLQYNNQGEFSWVSLNYDGRYIADEPTSLNGPLAMFCPDLIDRSSDRAFDSIRTIDGDHQVKVRFFVQTGRPAFEVTYLKRDDEGKMVQDYTDASLLYIPNGPSDFKGIVLERVQTRKCLGNTNAVDQFRQTLLDGVE